MQFQSLIQRIADTPLDALLPFLQQEYLQAIRYGDHHRWQELVANLPSVSPSSIKLGETIEIGAAADCDQATHDLIEAALRELIPWRKGPFTLFGIAIDTEWQSQLKWSRLAEHISPLTGKVVLDVGSGNGYYSLRMLEAGAELVIGLEPHIPYYAQFSAIKHFAPDLSAYVMPLTLEKMPLPLPQFDTVFSMGVIYHRRSPLDHLLQLRSCLKPGGQLVMESIIVDGEEGYSLVPNDRYARMSNVWFLPSIPTLCSWLEKCGFQEVRVVDETATTLVEQRRTEWMPFDSLENALSESDPSLTIEGYPAPNRVVVICEKPE